jgi:predicted GIY-YIG superfamily endonuclease
MSGYVYRAFDDAGRLLYVGCTVNMEGRLATHASSSPWYMFHARIEVETFPTRELAAEAEAVAIATEHPRWNMRGRSDDHPDGQCYDVQAAPWLAYERDLWIRWRKAQEQRSRAREQYAAATRALRAMEAEIATIKAGVTYDDLAGLTS